MTGGRKWSKKIQFLLWEVGCERGQWEYILKRGDKIYSETFGRKLWSEKCPIEKR
jgi:hypothetical protein